MKKTLPEEGRMEMDELEHIMNIKGEQQNPPKQNHI